MTGGRIRAGMGGWDYDPWRETFYPPRLPKSAQLHHASRQVTAIEVNGTFYRLQTPAVFAKWHDETPDDFVFSIKAPRYLTHRRTLPADAAALERFMASGLTALRHKLGPILWQLAPGKAFDAAELAAFLRVLPPEHDGLPLRHALEVRDESFKRAEFIALARQHRITTVFADSATYPSFADVTGDFVYARLMRTVSSEITGYSRPALESWAARAGAWARGGEPEDLPRVAAAAAATTGRDVFMFFISGAKERAPAAARHLLGLLAAPDTRAARIDRVDTTAPADTGAQSQRLAGKEPAARRKRSAPAGAAGSGAGPAALKARSDKPGTARRSSPRKPARR